MRKPFFLVALAMLTSCSTVKNYYQVYKTDSETVKQNSTNELSFEDTNCKITYNLWSNFGNAGFSFYNKTSEAIYLELDESFYVINGFAYDYFQNRTYITSSNLASSATNSTSATLWNKLSTTNYASNTIISNNTSGIETQEPRTITIPPKTSKTISEFDINQKLFRDCDLSRYPDKNQISTKSFTKETTPINFYNIITYKLGEKIQKIKNDFYVSSITNYNEKTILKQEKNTFCNQKNGRIINVFTQSASDKFYVKYIKSETDIWKY
ncbi:hypothetical protein [Flavobacterium sp.]